MKHKKLIIFFVVVVAIFVCNYFFGWTEYIKSGSLVDFLREMVTNRYFEAVMLYILLTVIGCVVLALPGSIFAVFAAILFEPWAGTAYCLIATTVGAMLAFLVGRFFLKDSIKPMMEKSPRLKRLLFDESSNRDMVLLMVTRLVPVFPYNLQNFAYGITNIRFSVYSLYTFIFMLPGVFFITFGAAGIFTEQNRAANLIPAGIGCLLVVGASIFLKKKYIDVKAEHGSKKRAIIILTRLPVARQTKTRLQPYLTPEQCARLHSCFLQDIYGACLKVESDVFIFVTPSDEQGIMTDLLGDIRVSVQIDGTLAERMEDAFARLFGQGYADVLLIGADIPELRQEHINAAFKKLEKCDAVFGRSLDGGYYLVGLKQPNKLIFEEENYLQPKVLDFILSKLVHDGAVVDFTESLLDIDTKEDLLELMRNLTEGDYKPEHTFKYMSELYRNSEMLLRAELCSVQYFQTGDCHVGASKNINNHSSI